MDAGDGNVLNQSSYRPTEIPDVGDGGNYSSACHEMGGGEWGLCNEQQLEELLLKNLEFLYNEAIHKIASLGYDEEIALKAVLRNGHCYGNADLLSNIIHNSLVCLNSGVHKDLNESGAFFGDLKQLEQYSLAGMVCLLQHVRPQLSKADAMWCLLMSDLHVGRASSFEFPLPSSGKNAEIGDNGPEERNWAVSPVGVSVPTPIRPSAANMISGTEVSEPYETNGRLRLQGADLNINGFMDNATTINSNFSMGRSSNSLNVSRSMKMMKRNAAYMFSSFSEAPRAAKHTPLGASVGCSRHSLTFCGHRRGRSGVWGLPQHSNLMKPQPDIMYERANSTGMMNVGTSSELPSGCLISPQYCGKSGDAGNLDAVSSIVGNLENLQLDEERDGVVDQRDEMVSKLMQQIEMQEKQLQERIEWAQKKALQAAKKLSKDLNELMILRMEREDTLRQKNKQWTEDVDVNVNVNDIFKLENALRERMEDFDQAKAAVNHLETKNAEIRAEMVAAKLNAAESIRKGLEVEKREKKWQKKLLGWEKQNVKLQEQVTEEKQRNNQLQQQLHLIKAAQKEAEMKWKHATRAKELTISQAEKESRAKEEAEANSARRQEALRHRIEIDFQRHKDDIKRLEEDLSRLKASLKSARPNCPSNMQSTYDANVAKRLKESITETPVELEKVQKSSVEKTKCDRECLICMKEEVSVVFLPCAHQVLCVGCNEAREKLSEKNCPSCDTAIEQRIRAYGIIS